VKRILKRKIEAGDWIRIAAIAVFLGLLAWAAAAYLRTFGQFTGLEAAEQAGNWLQRLLGNMNASGIAFRDYISAHYPKSGLAVMFLLQVLLVVIAAIPSWIVAFACSMIYGMGWGLLINIAGAALGTAISFYLARLLGRRVLTLFVSEKNISKIEKLLDGNTSLWVLLFLFIIPSPKDLFSYFIGLTNMKAPKYFLISLFGRLPTMLAVAYLGAHILDRNYVPLAVCFAAAVLATAFFVIFKDKIMAMLKSKKTVEET
jgi:uncharacterized membrane protein YdjX (TVP38/TMEM64 family)